jgi:hypothetical protein
MCMAKGAVFWTVTFFYGEQVLHAEFWATKRELSVGKSTIHVVLEGNHCCVMVMLEKIPVHLKNGL